MKAHEHIYQVLRLIDHARQISPSGGVITLPEEDLASIQNHATIMQKLTVEHKAVSIKQRPNRHNLSDADLILMSDSIASDIVQDYGQGMMSDDVYEERIKSVVERREKLAKLRVQNDEAADKISQLDPQQLVEAFQKLIQNMDFEAKQFTVRRIVDKIVATKEEVTICGFIPLMDNTEANNSARKVEYEPIYRYRRPPQRRQIYAVQRTDQQPNSGGQLSFCNHRA